jgi:hypothetical protein
MAVIEHSTDAIPTTVQTFGGVRILVVGEEAHFADIKSHVNELITEAWSQSVPTIAIPVDCLPPEFFQLRSGVAVAISQKLVNYRITVAFVGNIAERLLDSQQLGDFIRDCNRGRWIWFVDDMGGLVDRLAARDR